MSSDDEVQLANPVRKWAAMKRISDAAADILVDRLGFDSMEALALLTADDLQNCGMLRGQQKLVVQGVRNTFPSGNAALQDGCQDHPTETQPHTAQNEPDPFIAEVME